MWWRRLLVLGVALLITLLVFEFWGEVGSAMGRFLARQDEPGPVVVDILPSKK